MTTIKIELIIFLVFKVNLRFILFSTINAGKPLFITLHHVMKIITDCVCTPQKTQMNFDVIWIRIKPFACRLIWRILKIFVSQNFGPQKLSGSNIIFIPELLTGLGSAIQILLLLLLFWTFISLNTLIKLHNNKEVHY